MVTFCRCKDIYIVPLIIENINKRNIFQKQKFPGKD